MPRRRPSELLRTDVLIVGGGLVGQTLALALAAHDIGSVIIERAEPEVLLAPGFDGRASAVASASARMLGVLGLQGLLERDGCPIRAIEVAEGLNPEVIRFTPPEDDREPLGIMVENRLLRQALLEAVRASPKVTLLAPVELAALDRAGPLARAQLSDGREVEAPLVIAAEGRRSSLREAAGIRVAHWSYPSAALVTMVAHGRPHGSIALELFYPGGPLACLPMTDLPDGRHRSAIVWSVPRRLAPGLLALPPPLLAERLGQAMGDRLGRLELIAPAVSWPLGYHHAERYWAERLILVGDSAHGIHPIAGQGLNLGWRDVAALPQVLAEGARSGMDLGDPELARRYERWRRADNSLTAFATDTLARFFDIRARPVMALRRFGLGLVERLPPAKRAFAAIARGTAGDLPPLLRGELG